jgi:hypothetical protein
MLHPMALYTCTAKGVPGRQQWRTASERHSEVVRLFGFTVTPIVDLRHEPLDPFMGSAT